MRIAIDGRGYADATDAFARGNHAAVQRYQRLTGELDGCSAMAGDSSSSADFAATYDAGAAAAVAALGDLVAAFTTLGRLTFASRANHHDADRRSMLPGSAVYPDGELPTDLSSYAAVLPSTPPSSLGGDPSSLPDTLNWILDHVEGFVWPDADVDKLRTAAATWRTASDDLAVLVDYCDLAVGALAEEHSPEVPIAVDATRELKGGICDLAEQYHALATACEQYAAQVEEQRAALLDLLWDLLRDSAIIQGVGLALGFLTAGATTAGASAINTARITAQVPRLMELVQLVRNAASAAAAVIRTAGQVLARVRSVLGRFAGVVLATDARALTLALHRRDRLARIGRTLRDPRRLDPEDLRGVSGNELRQVLSDWRARPPRSGDGVIYGDPTRHGRQIRIMDGYPGNRPDALTHGPYAVVSQNGAKPVKIPLEGNPTL